MKERPLFTFGFSRDWYRRRGFVFVAIIAPFPKEEQIDGELCAALINAEVQFFGHWPFVRASIYAPNRAEHIRRVEDLLARRARHRERYR